LGWTSNYDNGRVGDMVSRHPTSLKLRRDCAAVGRSAQFGKASAVARGAMADELARVYCVKMLRKVGSGGAVYVSAKRTQIIWRGKQGLSDCMATGSDLKIESEKLGSFWKTNPILGSCFWVLVDI
jgi:hypothetical protein